MNIFLAAAIVVVTTAVAVAAMLVVRRHAPDGSYFNDGDRAAGVFGVLATGFAVLLGFVVFLAFASYDAARQGAETEARVVAQQVETAQLFPPAFVEPLTAGLVCYAYSVAGVQWQRMANGAAGARAPHRLCGRWPLSPLREGGLCILLRTRGDPRLMIVPRPSGQHLRSPRRGAGLRCKTCFLNVAVA